MRHNEIWTRKQDIWTQNSIYRLFFHMRKHGIKAILADDSDRIANILVEIQMFIITVI